MSLLSEVTVIRRSLQRLSSMLLRIPSSGCFLSPSSLGSALPPVRALRCAWVRCIDRHRDLEQERVRMKVKILQWHAVASWTWDAHDDACGICRMAFDGCCPDCKMPGDDCPLMWGACNHAFHLHCILKWVNSQSPRPQCPMCRRDWKFRGD